MSRREQRVAELSEAIRADGSEPILRNLPGGKVEVTSRDRPGIKATVSRDGSSVEQWAGVNPQTGRQWETRTEAPR
jgi:hypothetical protein